MASRPSCANALRKLAASGAVSSRSSCISWAKSFRVPEPVYHILSLHRDRDLLVRQRAQLINGLRGLAAGLSQKTGTDLSYRCNNIHLG